MTGMLLSILADSTKLIFLPMLAIAVTAQAGMKSYFKQKEYELVREKYLDKGVELAALAAARTLDTFHHNWAVGLKRTHALRDFGTIPTYPDLEWIALDKNRFANIAHHRVQAILGSDIAWKLHEQLLAFVESASLALYEDFYLAAANLAENDRNTTTGEIYDAARDLYQEKDNEAHVYQEYVMLITRLGMLLEDRAFDLKAIHEEAKYDEDIVDVRERLEKLAKSHATNRIADS